VNSPRKDILHTRIRDHVVENFLAVVNKSHVSEQFLPALLLRRIDQHIILADATLRVIESLIGVLKLEQSDY